MKIQDIEEFDNRSIVRLAEILEKNEEVLFSIRNKLVHIGKAGVEIYSVNVFNSDEIDDLDNLDFGFAVDAGMLYFKSTIEVIVLANNNFK